MANRPMGIGAGVPKRTKIGPWPDKMRNKKREAERDAREPSTPPLSSIPLTDQQRDEIEAKGLLDLCDKTSEYFARRCPYIAKEEFYQESFRGLADAYKGFDPGRNLKFITFCHYRMHGACIDLMQRSGLIHVPIGLGKEVFDSIRFVPMGQGHENGHEDDPLCGGRLAQIADDTPEPWAAIESSDSIEAWLRCLNNEERRILLSYVVDGRSMKQIACDLDCSEARVSLKYNDIISRLRDRAALPQFRFLAGYRTLATA